MFRDVAIVSVPVFDQERAKLFYVDTLGFELVRENPMGPDQRWIEAKPPRGETSLTLVTWFETMPPGSLKGLVFWVDDVAAAHEDLSARGVEFSVPPEEQPWGTQAVLRETPTGTGACSCRRPPSWGPLPALSGQRRALRRP